MLSREPRHREEEEENHDIPKISLDSRSRVGEIPKQIDFTHQMGRSTSTPPSSPSIKNFFRQKDSIKSIDSITEVPEPFTHPNQGSSIVNPLKGSPSSSPTRSLKLVPGSLRPKFTRSKSSGLTVTHPITSHIGSRSKPVEVSDFADTSSSGGEDDDNDSSNDDYDAESINSILDEYNTTALKLVKNSSPSKSPRKSKFYEDLDEPRHVPEHVIKVRIPPNTKNDENIEHISTKHQEKLPMKSQLKNPMSSSNNQMSPASKNIQRKSKTKSIIELTLSEHSSSSSSNSPTSFYDAQQGPGGSPTAVETSISSPGPKFNIFDDKIKTGGGSQTNQASTRRIPRREVISVSSNVNTSNRSSLYNLTTVSAGGVETSGPEHGNSPQSQSQSPQVPNEIQEQHLRHSNEPNQRESITTVSFADISEQPLNKSDVAAARWSTITDETILKELNTTRERESPAKSNSYRDGTDTFSLSSGELLATLQSFYGEGTAAVQRQQSVKGQSPRLIDVRRVTPEVHAIPDSQRNTLSGNLSPIRAEFDTEAASAPAPPPPPPIIDSVAIPERAYSSSPTLSQSSRITEYINKNLNPGIEEFRRSHPSQSQASSIHPPVPTHYQDSLSKKTSHERMLESISPNKSPVVTSAVTKDSSQRYHIPHDLEKGTDGKYNNRNHNSENYSWVRFFAMISLGFIAPPIFFLLTMGSFDSRKIPSSCYTGTGSYYYANGEKRRKFSTTQKLTSLVLGLFWCAVVVAMIGVGFGVGLSRVT
ncbi:hypothetical protein CAAN1_27S00518 [[Candida] anglica]|uniref:Uncharacterized protein n=1 Tax=[Candida] anglica TaxID=148631 RepID=A0ABP0EC60_9ASCO